MYASFLLQRPYLNIATMYLHQIEYRDFLKAWVHLHLLICENICLSQEYMGFFFISCHFSLGNNRFYTPVHSDLQYLAMNNHFWIPDWLPNETVLVSDFNFDPAPPEMLLFTAKKCPFIKPSAGFTLDIPNEQPSLDWIGTG